MFPPNVPLSGDNSTHQADRRSAIDEHGKFLAVNLSRHCWTGSTLPEFGLTGVISLAGDVTNESEMNFALCGRGPARKSCV